jgi:hypothetical protein
MTEQHCQLLHESAVGLFTSTEMFPRETENSEQRTSGEAVQH